MLAAIRPLAFVVSVDFCRSFTYASIYILVDLHEFSIIEERTNSCCHICVFIVDRELASAMTFVVLVLPAWNGIY